MEAANIPSLKEGQPRRSKNATLPHSNRRGVGRSDKSIDHAPFLYPSKFGQLYLAHQTLGDLKSDESCMLLPKFAKELLTQAHPAPLSTTTCG